MVAKSPVHSIELPLLVTEVTEYQATTCSARAIGSSHQDSARNAFELCLICTVYEFLS